MGSCVSANRIRHPGTTSHAAHPIQSVTESEVLPFASVEQRPENADDDTKPEPQPCWHNLAVEFKDSEGQISTVPFVMTPLGINYCNSWPPSVTKVNLGGHAEELGVKEGWTIWKIADKELVEEDVQKEKFITLATDFYQQVQKLPQRTDIEKKKRKEQLKEKGARITFQDEEDDSPVEVEAAAASVPGEIPSMVPAAIPSMVSSCEEMCIVSVSTTEEEAEKRPLAGDLRARPSTEPGLGPDGTPITLEVLFQKSISRQVEAEGEGEQITIRFVRRPLGFRFANDSGASPVVVTSVSPGSHAEELGVKLNWKLIKVGGIMVTDFSKAEAKVAEHLDDQAFENLQKHFKESAMALPTKEALEAELAAASRRVPPAVPAEAPSASPPAAHAASIEKEI